MAEMIPPPQARSVAVIGLSGVRLYARDPVALARWYSTHLGLGMQSEEGGSSGCFHSFDAAATANSGSAEAPSWGVIPSETGAAVPDERCLVGYRVLDLDASLAALKAGGVEFEGPVECDHGRYAWLRDPEGNPVELYEARSPSG